jgi:ATP-binding cassette subfamily C protein EexD
MPSTAPVRAAPVMPAPAPLRAALRACRGSLVAAGVFSLVVNLLLILPAIYMLQVYDRVLTSGSEPTLLVLTLAAVFVFLVMGGLEWVRSQILVFVSGRLEQLLAPRVHDAVFTRTRATSGRLASAQPLGDLLQLRQFLTGPGLLAFFDAPWLPVYVAVMFLFHPAFGVAAIVSAAVLLGLALWNEAATHADLAQAQQRAAESGLATQRQLRNVDAVEAMGLLPRLRERWWQGQLQVLALQLRASRVGGLISAASRTWRHAVQTLILGLGAWLALRHELSPGAVVAGSILLGRALAPLDVMIANWRGFNAAREAWRRLDSLLAAVPDRPLPMALPAPRGELRLEALTVLPPGAPAPVLRNVTLRVEPGQLLAVIGPSGAGKSTLARAMLGLVPPSAGAVRLDGAELSQWDRAALGPHVGYLPQDVELLDGTVAENIARFGAVDAERVVAAAHAAGVHELVLRLPQGYETVLAGPVVSAGQRQRIALARALYGDPKVVVLDEPNSNLDQDGEAALERTLRELRRAGRTAVVVTHRRNLLAQVDRIVVITDGQVSLAGPRDQVLAALQQAIEPHAPRAAAARGEAANVPAAEAA